MKIITDNKLYIQKKDLDLIFKLINNKDIPSNIIKKYKENAKINDLEFMFFENNEEIDFLNKFWFVINLNDIIDLNDKELDDYNYNDLINFRSMRVEYDKHKFIFYNKIYTDFMEILIDEADYRCFIPNRDEAQKYPLDFQLLYNKVTDAIELKYYRTRQSKLEFPNEILKPIRYSKKQLQKIYYEVLGQNLSFEELKPYERWLYLIFSKIDYTPEILDIISKIMIISRYNTLDFINDDLLDILLHILDKKNKFEEQSSSIIDYLYAIGYNKFDNFDSKIVLEKDLKIIKKIINYIGYANLEDEYIDKLEKYNYVLAEITRTLNKCNYSLNNSLFVKDVILNMMVYTYFNPSAINYNYEFLIYAHNFVLNNAREILNITGYERAFTIHEEHFVANFNRANNILMYLYNQKYNDNRDKEIHKLIKSKEE